MANVRDYLIWPEHPGEIGDASYRGNLITDCERAGGDYIISLENADWLRSPRGVRLRGEESTGLRARLTTLLVDQRSYGEPYPEVTKELIQRAMVKRPLPIHERANRLLRFIAEQTRVVGKGYDAWQDNLAAYARSESINEEEISYLIDFLLKKNLLETIHNVGTRKVGNYRTPAIVIVTVEGHSQIEQRENIANAAQAFVAMWFDTSMDKVFDDGIAPAIVGAGYSAQKINLKPDINKIDDEIIAEFRRSQFLVADFTHGDNGARGGVYFEAGFAHGLGIPVIYTCRGDMVDKLHFDTRQYAHIVWDTPEELRDGLKNRIIARLGEGPGL